MSNSRPTTYSLPFGATGWAARIACGLVATSLWGCGPDDAPPEDRVSISFAVVAGDRSFACGTEFEQIGTTGGSLSVTDARLYVHDVALISSDGSSTPVALDADGVWQNADVALLDFEDGSGPCAGNNGNAGTHTVVEGLVPAGSYVGLEFRVGVPFEQNHQNSAVAAAPLSYTSMFWGWEGGYKFVRLEGTTAEGNSTRLHLGSTGCEGTLTNITGCSNENIVRVRLPEFDPRADTVTIDVAALFGGVDIEANTENTPAGCMSTTDDPDCSPFFLSLGLGPVPQSVFGVR